MAIMREAKRVKEGRANLTKGMKGMDVRVARKDHWKQRRDGYT